MYSYYSRCISKMNHMISSSHDVFRKKGSMRLVHTVHISNHKTDPWLSTLITTGVKIVEVGPRDGLQNETHPVSTQDKLTLISKLIQAHVSNIEVTSFVSPKWVPSMADASQVVQGIQSWRRRRNDEQNQRIFMALTPNLVGFKNALLAGGVDQVAIFGSASEAFSQKNIHCSIQESLHRFQQVIDLAKDHQIPVRGYVSCALGCPYQGHIDPTQVAHIAKQLVDMGCFEISLGDTIGIGTAGSTIEMIRQVKTMVHVNQLAVHFHDTYGQALVNIYAALSEGITTIDCSVAGLGGCPYADGSSGNVCTEDVVYMLNGLGIPTGIDLEKLMDAGAFICNVLGRETRSKVALALRKKKLTCNESSPCN